MKNKKYLLDFEVEAHACLEQDLEQIQLTHPRNEYEIHISNLQVDRGVDRPLLSVQIIVPGDDINKMEKIGISILKKHLHYLSFVSNKSFRIHKLIRIIDWTPEVKKRKWIQFERFPGSELPYPGSELPYPILNEKLFKTIETLQKIQINTAFERALKWFSNGISAESLDDQFQYFWFVIELLAQFHKKVEKVNDPCPKCLKPLFCEECNEFPTHRPYPKQAIKQLFEKIITDKPQEFFNTTNNIRNSIMHGKSTEEIEKQQNIDLSVIVDKLGLLAYWSIYRTFAMSHPPHSDDMFHFIRTKEYSKKILCADLYFTLVTEDLNTPELSKIPKPEINLIYPDNNE